VLRKLSWSLLTVAYACSFSAVALAQVTAQPSTNLPSHMPTEMNRPVSINGQVVFDNGAPMTASVAILRICGSMVHREAVTNARGTFNFILSDKNTNGTLQGASEGGGTTLFGAQLEDQASQTTRTQLWGCEIRASLPGYTSSAVSLAGRDFSIPVNIGPIVLHPVIPAGTTIFSLLDVKMPPDAKKELEKGQNDFSKKKYPDAEKHFSKAVKIYPQYSQAWELLARAQRLQRNNTEAEKSYLNAINADEKSISPYIQLAGLYASQGNWDGVLRLTRKVIGLDANAYPDAYFLEAFAFYNLKRLPEAEYTARKAVQTDKQHRFPRAELLLGRILQMKGDNAAAAEHLRNYLRLEPNSPQAPNIQSFLDKQKE